MSGLTIAPQSFWAATWNVYHGTPIKTLEPILHQQLDARVTLFYFQEASHAGFTDMLDRAGLAYQHQGELCVAWVPEDWQAIAQGDHPLSENVYYTKAGHRVQSHAAWAILSDLEGRTLTALSYHTPSHVQVLGAPERRLVVLKDSMRTLRALAHSSATDAALFAGDDNVDESKDRTRWAFMLRPATGMRLVMAPTPTHAGGRRIDDFRVKGDLKVGLGRTAPGGGDHRIHARRFRWAWTPGHYLAGVSSDSVSR